MNHSTIASIGEAFTQISEALRLAPGHDVEHDAHSAEFAKHYVKAKKGDHRPGGPTAQHEKDSEEFHNTYDSHGVRHGFGGSGTTVYTHKQTGHTFEVNRTANGRGFWGTTHSIRHLPKPVAESSAPSRTPDELSAHAHDLSKTAGHFTDRHYAAMTAHRAAADAHHAAGNRDKWKQHWNHHDFHMSKVRGF